MTPLPQAGDLTGLLERLERRDEKWLGSAGIAPLFNPDGPEAAQAIRQLSSDLEACRKDAEAYRRAYDTLTSPKTNHVLAKRRLMEARRARETRQPKEPA